MGQGVMDLRVHDMQFSNLVNGALHTNRRCRESTLAPLPLPTPQEQEQGVYATVLLTSAKKAKRSVQLDPSETPTQTPGGLHAQCVPFLSTLHRMQPNAQQLPQHACMEVTTHTSPSSPSLQHPPAVTLP
jgi:hypothetical protein